MIHQITFHFPQNTQKLNAATLRKLDKFLRALQQILPCPTCRDHFNMTLKRTPPAKTMLTGGMASEWGVKAHNIVNKGLKKKIVSYQEAVAIHKGKFVHSRANNFIRYMLIRNTRASLRFLRNAALYMIELFPCDHCSRGMFQYYERTKVEFNKMKNMTQWTRWSTGLFEHYRKVARHRPT
jgi:hypothetical protein